MSDIDCVANSKHTEIRCITFFPLPTLLTVWLAEDCHFGPKAAKCHLWVSHNQNVHVGGGGQKCLFFKTKNCQNVHKKMVCSKCPQMSFGVSHDKNLHSCWVKNAKICNKMFAPNAPKSHLGVSHDQNCICSGSKMPNVGVKMT